MASDLDESLRSARRHARTATVLAWVSIAFAVVAVVGAVMSMVTG